jgi:chromosomal replication initiator protein
MSAVAMSSENFGPETVWSRILPALQTHLGKDACRNWIDPLVYLGADRGVGRFTAPTGFIGVWVSRNYGETVRKLLVQEGEPVSRLEFSVCEDSARRLFPGRSGSAARPAAETAAAPVVAAPAIATSHADAADVELPTSPLDSRFTFDSFVVGKPNELAHAAARRVAERSGVSFNPLFLYGGVGLGKTHLMHAIAWELRQNDPTARVLYLSAEQFMYRFISAIRFKEMHGFKELFRSVDMLMVDDVQFIAGKDSTQDEFFHTFNALIDQHKQIIISADRAPGEIDGLEERIKSRLQWGLVVDLHPTDYELRLGILQSKAEAQLLEHPGVTIGSGVMEFLAHRISSNVRVLEGALNRLFAFASLVGRDINLDMTQECLADILRASERKVTIEEILRKVADHYNLRMSDLLSARRARNVARPRQVAMYLAKTLTSRSLPDIGRRFGGRDHTTVIHAVRKIEELKATDSQIAEDVELLRRMLEA